MAAVRAATVGRLVANIMRSAGFVLLLLLSLGVAVYAVTSYGLLPLGAVVHPDMRAAFEAHRLAIYVHVFASAVALTFGPMQFSRRLRTARPTVHRWSGRLYLLIGVLVGGVTGLVLAFHAFGGLVSQLGFGCLAVSWLYTGIRAYVAIRSREIAAHRRWMVRNFALTFAAVTLRLWLPAAVAAGVPFDLAYPAIAWLCWVPNLLLAERWIVRPRGAVLPRSASVEAGPRINRDT